MPGWFDPAWLDMEEAPENKFWREQGLSHWQDDDQWLGDPSVYGNDPGDGGGGAGSNGGGGKGKNRFRWGPVVVVPLCVRALTILCCSAVSSILRVTEFPLPRGGGGFGMDQSRAASFIYGQQRNGTSLTIFISSQAPYTICFYMQKSLQMRYCTDAA